MKTQIINEKLNLFAMELHETVSVASNAQKFVACITKILVFFWHKFIFHLTDFFYSVAISGKCCFRFFFGA